MAETSWHASARGTKAELNTSAKTARNAYLTAHKETANATTEAQWTAALAAAVTLIDALTAGDSTREFQVQVSGSDDGLPAGSTQPLISVTVQRVVV